MSLQSTHATCRLHLHLPIIQAPMAGSQGSALALAVAAAGGLGSIPCAMLSMEALRSELQALRAGIQGPYNVNFFCHTPPEPDAARMQRWNAAVRPYHLEMGIDPDTIPAGPGRSPFSAEAAALLAEFKPAVVSFHFGLPAADLLAQVKAWGATVMSSATTLQEALVAGGARCRRHHCPGRRGRWPPWDVSDR